ncbi:hypothetical protein PVAP13_9NG297800 [Panicum virgatum]|uniref:Uncharacterized protein n=1 Tax=Panicum virgatum TaxID=38727 RepID=A0A8T0ML29_PANVG|nr:hypothetical protein PVAP13_9NG297800 [Panicum virgatum]
MIYKGQYEGLDYPAIVLFIAQMMTQPPAKPTPPSSSQTVGDANPVIMSNCNSKFKDNYRSCRTAQTYGSTWDLNFCRQQLATLFLQPFTATGKTATSANAKAQGIFPKRRLQPSSQYVSACQDKGNLFR